MGDKKKVAVKIRGKEYVIACTEDEEYIQKLAYYVDRKLNQITNANPLLSSDMAAILTSVNVADELLKAIEVIDKLKQKIPSSDLELKQYVDNFCKVQSEEFLKKEEPVMETASPEE
ncbi:MAG: cell division protein ZapA [Clostridia bacterium]|nr:cell division protein ZapA [Clostridia bacterium]